MATRRALSDEELTDLARESLTIKAGEFHRMATSIDELKRMIHDSNIEQERARGEMLASLGRIEGEVPRLHHRITDLDAELQNHKKHVQENYVTSDSFEPVKRAFYGVGITVLGSIIVQVYLYMVD